MFYSGYRLKIISVSFFILCVLILKISFAENDTDASNTAAQNQIKPAISYSELNKDEINKYVTDLIGKANDLKLYDDPYWLSLLHYRRTYFTKKSLIDDPKFFTAKDGKYNPKSELEETLKAFFSDIDASKVHPRCRFMARFTWLKSKLNIDESKMPVECDEYKKIIDTIKPQGITLIFPTSHMNNPASMYGHTLLIIETTENSRLLSYAVNYSADTNETFGPLFALRGIFGFYKGYISVLPYYIKVMEYSDVSQRDIWEYKLNLNKEEISRLIMHLYELDNVYADYYFFDENCSFCILFLFDIARPGLKLTDKVPIWVIPVDTIRDIIKQNLAEDIVYRPSRAEKIKYIASLLNTREQDYAIELANKKAQSDSVNLLNIATEKKIYIYDLARDYVQYKYSKKDMSQEEYAKLFVNLSAERSKLGNPEDERYKVKEPGEPSKGHKSSRFAIGAGANNENEYFQEIKWRFAYHDLTDYNAGYLPGSQIQFGNIELRFNDKEQKLELSKLDIIDIVSIPTFERFFKQISWKFNTGFITKYIFDNRHLVYQTSTGGGFAYDIKYIGKIYAFAEPQIDIANAFENKYALGFGGSTGTVNNIINFWNIHIYMRDIYYVLGDMHNELEISLQNNFKINSDNSIRFEISSFKYSDYDYKTEAKISWNIYL